MGQILLIGLAAGAASALLFASLASGTLLSIPLFYLSPLPILIAAIGWSHLAGLIAAIVAAAALAVIFGGFFFVSFLIGIGLPAWWLGYLALLARPIGDAGAGTLEWYPVGRILIWAAVISTVVVAFIILTIATSEDGLRTALRAAFEPMLTRRGRVTDADNAFVRMLTEYPHRVLPPAASVLTTVVTVFSLWLAGRIVRTSGRLRRPWPDIAATTFPMGALLLLAVVLAGALVISGMPGIFAGMLAASLLTVFGMLGLCVLHSMTVGVNGRGLMLSAVYGAVFIFGWPILILALVAMADMVLDLRGRAAANRPAAPPD